MRARHLAVPLLLLTLAVLAAPAAVSAEAPVSVQAAAAQPRHAAAVVIDTGAEVRKVCVRFDEPELTGEELLRRAEVQAVFAEYSIGMAVCALCGVGCPADDCFCESEASGRYWNYSRGDGAGWRRSELGASSTTVRDGDVDGWAWGTEGATPPWIGFESICVEVEASPTAGPKSSATSSPAAHAAQPASPPPASTATTVPHAAHTTEPAVTEPTASQAPPAEPADSAAGGTTVPTPDTTPTASEQAVLSVEQDQGGSGLGGLAAFAGGAVALGAGAVLARRRLG